MFMLESAQKAKSIGIFIKNHVPFLEKFVFRGFQEKNGLNIWTYTSNYISYKFHVFIAEKNEKWKCKMVVYWKEQTPEPTSGAGKDFEFEIGPFNSFEELSSVLEKRMLNNPIMGNHIYNDDYLNKMDLEAVRLMKLLQKSGNKLAGIKDSFFDDVKKIYQDIKGMSEKSLISYCRVKFTRETEKQDFILDLQKLEKVDFYVAMHNMNRF